MGCKWSRSHPRIDDFHLLLPRNCLLLDVLQRLLHSAFHFSSGHCVVCRRRLVLAGLLRWLHFISEESKRVANRQRSRQRRPRRAEHDGHCNRSINSHDKSPVVCFAIDKPIWHFRRFSLSVNAATSTFCYFHFQGRNNQICCHYLLPSLRLSERVPNCRLQLQIACSL